MDLINEVYDRTIRDSLPRRMKVLNGVVANTGRLLDMTLYEPEYKAGSVEPIREYVRETDGVTVVGGGRGVTTSVAALQGASVTSYEASEEYCEITLETVSLNHVSDRVDVVHSPVGPVFDGFGDGVESNGISPSELEECDVIELDCEGAEMDILNGLEFSPRVAIVEAHPQFGVSEYGVRSWLENNGYEIVNIHEYCPSVTLTGVKDGE